MQNYIFECLSGWHFLVLRPQLKPRLKWFHLKPFYVYILRSISLSRPLKEKISLQKEHLKDDTECLVLCF